jgi:hypothetical protein
MGVGPLKVEVDLMQPLDPDKKPAVHTTPLNHVGLWIDDLPKAVEWLTAQGASRQAAFRHLFPAPEGERGISDRGRGRAGDGAGAGFDRRGLCFVFPRGHLGVERRVRCDGHAFRPIDTSKDIAARRPFQTIQ